MLMLEALKSIKYPDIINTVSDAPKDKELHKRMKLWYSKRMRFNKDNNVTYELLNLVLIIGMRKNNGRIPANEYLNKTLDTMLAFGVNSLQSGIAYFEKHVIGYEIEKQANKEEAKEMYKNKAIIANKKGQNKISDKIKKISSN